MPTAAMLSFRFSDTDGVSVVARTWMHELRRLGFDVLTIAGSAPADRVVPGLGIRDTRVPSDDDLAAALADIDLTVVENLGTIPLNPAASLAAGRVLSGRPSVIHHHDPPWHRPEWRDVTELPLDDPTWRHVVITEADRRAFAQRGIEATLVRNAFAEPSPGDRTATRESLGVGDELLVVHPVRAIPRKDVGAALALAEGLGATYWLTGPAEDGFGPELDRLLAQARCRVIHHPCGDLDDLYAAADLVAFTSTWEGFGNPPIEAALRRRWTAVGPYPVADELRDLGFTFLDPGDVDQVRAALGGDDDQTLDRNRDLARQHFSLQRLRDDLAQLLDAAGWMP